MPLAMCCSPNAAVSISEDTGRVVENVRRGVRTGREMVGTMLREVDEKPLGIMVVFVMYRTDNYATPN
jgi:hypothetical protein